MMLPTVKLLLLGILRFICYTIWENGNTITQNTPIFLNSLDYRGFYRRIVLKPIELTDCKKSCNDDNIVLMINTNIYLRNINWRVSGEQGTQALHWELRNWFLLFVNKIEKILLLEDFLSKIYANFWHLCVWLPITLGKLQMKLLRWDQNDSLEKFLWFSNDLYPGITNQKVFDIC